MIKLLFIKLLMQNRSDSMGSIAQDVKPVISVKGQVEFGLQYNYKLACLEVKVVGCRDVAAADSKRNRSDPLVANIMYQIENYLV